MLFRSQAITVLSPGCKLDIVNGSRVSAKYYYGIVNYAEDATVNIKDSEIFAWGAIYLKYDKTYPGSGSTVNIESSEIKGTSPHGYGSSNAFATIIFEQVENCTVNVDQSSSVIAAGEHNEQSVVSFQYMYNSTDPNPSNNTFNLYGTAQVMNPEKTDSFISYNGNGTTDPSNRVVVFNTAKFLVKDGDSAWIETDENGAFRNAYTTPAEAKIGERQFRTLSAAVSAAQNGDTVILLKDVALSSTLITKETMTLNLGGKKITSTDPSYAVAAIKGTLTVCNGTIEITSDNGTALYAQQATTIVGSGAVIRANGNAVQVGNCIENQPGVYNGDAVVEDGAFIQGETGILVAGPYPVSALQADGNLSEEQSSRSALAVTGGTIVGTSYGISGNGTYHGTEITISGGTVKATGEGGGALYHPQNGVLNISGDAAFEGPSGVQICSGEGVIADITGGSFAASGADQRADKTDDGFIPDGAALSVVNRGYPGGIPKMRVSGGYFSAAKNDAVLAYTWSNNEASPWVEANQYITIEDGYFTSDPSAYAAKDRTGVDSGRSDYPFTIGRRGDKMVPVAAAVPKVKEPTVIYPEEPEKAELLEKAKAALEAPDAAPSAVGTGLESAAKSQANKNTETVTKDIVTELDAVVVGSTVTAETTHIVVQHYVEMTIAGVDTAEGKKSITLDIQPMYRTVATTVNVETEPEKEIILDSDAGSPVNAVVIGKPRPAGYKDAQSHRPWLQSHALEIHISL